MHSTQIRSINPLLLELETLVPNVSQGSGGFIGMPQVSFTHDENSFSLSAAALGASISVTGNLTAGVGTLELAANGLDQLPANIVDLAGSAVHDALGRFAGAATVPGQAGNDILHAIERLDVIAGGHSVDTIVIHASTSGVLDYSLHDRLLSITTASGTQTLSHVDRVHLTDAMFAFDTQAPSANAAGGHVWQAAALLHAGFGAMPDLAALSHWTAEADHSASMGELAQKIIDSYAPGISSADLVSHLYQSLLHAAPTADVLQGLVEQIGAGQNFATQGDLFAYAANLTENTDLMVGFAGSMVQLDASFFG